MFVLLFTFPLNVFEVQLQNKKKIEESFYKTTATDNLDRYLFIFN